MASLQHFLVPLDGSVMAEAALPVAVGLGRPLGARITLVHMVERSAPRTIHGEPHLRDPASAAAYLPAVAQHWASEGIVIDWHVETAEAGDVARGIVAYAEAIGADLIILTTHGSGGLRDLLFGSIAQQVVRRGKTPTVIVRPPTGGQLEPYTCRTILVPLDGSRDAEIALDYAQTIARATGARLMLASVVPTIGTASGDLVVSATFTPTATAALLDLVQDDAARYLEAKASALREEGREVHTSVTRGRTAQQLAQVADLNQVNLIVLATHGRSGLDGTFAGSVAPRLLSEFSQPVLLVRITGDERITGNT
ncbi:MAG: universal stress protein [Chloroflexi bacterium]|nr:universal stress protein [Chloroflexota bacterium]